MDFFKNNIRKYIYLNILFYSVLGLAMVLGCLYPENQQQFYEKTHTAISSINFLADMKVHIFSGQIIYLLPLAGFFLVKNFLSALLTIGLPNTIIPFSGFLTGFYQAAVFGYGFAPTKGINLSTLGSLFLVILEGQGAILVMLGSWVWSSHWFSFQSYGHPSRIAGYKYGFQLFLKATLFSVLILFVAAIYETLLIWQTGI